MRIWHMIYKNVQISTAARVWLGEAAYMLPLHETVVYPSTVFVCFAFRVVDSMHCFSSPISPWCLILLQSLQGTKKQIYSQKMKKFRQNFFESFQSDWRKKNKSIAKYFLGRLQKNMFFLKKCKQKRVSFSWGIFKFIWAFLFCGETYA